jgi:hypothetical protein
MDRDHAGGLVDLGVVIGSDRVLDETAVGFSPKPTSNTDMMSASMSASPSCSTLKLLEASRYTWNTPMGTVPDRSGKANKPRTPMSTAAEPKSGQCVLWRRRSDVRIGAPSACARNPGPPPTVDSKSSSRRPIGLVAKTET